MGDFAASASLAMPAEPFCTDASAGAMLSGEVEGEAAAGTGAMGEDVDPRYEFAAPRWHDFSSRGGEWDKRQDAAAERWFEERTAAASAAAEAEAAAAAAEVDEEDQAAHTAVEADIFEDDGEEAEAAHAATETDVFGDASEEDVQIDDDGTMACDADREMGSIFEEETEEEEEMDVAVDGAGGSADADAATGMDADLAAPPAPPTSIEGLFEDEHGAKGEGVLRTGEEGRGQAAGAIDAGEARANAGDAGVAADAGGHDGCEDAEAVDARVRSEAADLGTEEESAVDSGRPVPVVAPTESARARKRGREGAAPTALRRQHHLTVPKSPAVLRRSKRLQDVRGTRPAKTTEELAYERAQEEAKRERSKRQKVAARQGVSTSTRRMATAVRTSGAAACADPAGGQATGAVDAARRPAGPPALLTAARGDAKRARSEMAEAAEAARRAIKEGGRHATTHPLGQLGARELNTEARFKRRAEFDRRLASQREEERREHEAAEAERAAAEAAELARLRSEDLVHKARPVPDFSLPFAPALSDAPLTTPVSPALGPRSRRRGAQVRAMR